MSFSQRRRRVSDTEAAWDEQRLGQAVLYSSRTSSPLEVAAPTTR